MDSSVTPLRHGELSLIQTTDFFYPNVEDPYMMVMAFVNKSSSAKNCIATQVNLCANIDLLYLCFVCAGKNCLCQCSK
jgi:hypothetical protein